MRAPRATFGLLTVACFGLLLAWCGKPLWNWESARLPPNIEIDEVLASDSSFDCESAIYRLADSTISQLSTEGIAYLKAGISRAAVAFASKAGPLWANHFATLVEGQEQLKELGRLTLWDGAQQISFREA